MVKDRHRLSSDEIWVNTFDEEAAKHFRAGIQYRAQVMQDPHCPIIVYIDSYGGSVDALASMIETMNACPNPIITVCHGKAMSGGAMLLAHGEYRFCSPHSRVMIHETSSGAHGNVHDLQASSGEVARLNKHFMSVFAKDCGIKGGYPAIRKMFKELDSRECWLSAEGAHEMGIVDNIGLPYVIINKTYEIGIV